MKKVLNWFLIKNKKEDPLKENQPVPILAPEKAKLENKKVNQPAKTTRKASNWTRIILFYLCDAAHALGVDYSRKNPSVKIEDSAKFQENLGRIFCATRRITIDIDECKKENFENIVQFLKIDFKEYCNFSKSSMDIEKYEMMCKQIKNSK